MAIVKMQHLQVIALAEKRDDLLSGLMRLGCVEISDPAPLKSDESLAGFERESSAKAQTQHEISEVSEALAALARCGAEKDGLFIKRKPVEKARFYEEADAAKARAAADAISALLVRERALLQEQNRLSAEKLALTPWLGSSLELEHLETHATLVRYCVSPAALPFQALSDALSEAGLAAAVYEVSSDKLQRYSLLIAHKADDAAACDALRRVGCSLQEPPVRRAGTPKDACAEIDHELEENAKAQEAVRAEIGTHASERDLLRLHLDRLNAFLAKDETAEHLLGDSTVLLFEGWAPRERMPEIMTFLHECGCAWEVRDPTEDETREVPVLLKNNAFTKPLNTVTEMYSLPAYNNLDPNPLMAPFFILFYGIMMADMGYGILMIAASLLIGKKYAPKGLSGNLFSLMGLCGISTFIFGALTGGFFGDFLTQLVSLVSPGTVFTLPALFTPLGDTLMILIGCMALGGVQIIVGMAISVYLKLKRKAYLDAFFEEITWWIVFAGIALAALGKGTWVLALGVVLVLLGPIVQQKGFGKITGIFSSLYNHITGYFGDILSYSRLMALMLAGSVIAQVFNTLGAIPGNVIFFIVVALIGNALNFALNLLGCFVHDLRLQCLEYFNKFYEDGGRPFRPLAPSTRYVDIVDPQ